MKTLTEDLRKAVQEENYETAAALRDEIKQLEHRTGEFEMKFQNLMASTGEWLRGKDRIISRGEQPGAAGA